MAVIVRVVLEPVEPNTEAEVIDALVYAFDAERGHWLILGGEIVGLERTVDLTPPTPEPTEP